MNRTNSTDQFEVSNLLGSAAKLSRAQLDRRKFLLISGGAIGLSLLAACADDEGDDEGDDEDVAADEPEEGAETEEPEETEDTQDTEEPEEAEEDPEETEDESEDDAEEDNGDAAADGGELTIAMGDDTSTFDPDLFQTVRATAMYQLVWNTPIKVDENLEFQPDLAETWEYIDETTIEFHLREDITWADGEPLTADDFVYTWERMTDENRESLMVPRFSAWVEEVVAVDQQTVQFNAMEPFAPGLETIANGYYVYPRHYLEGLTDLEYEENPLGSGPYRLVSREYNQQSTFEPVENWWGGSQPFSQVQFVIIPEPFPRTTALLTGEVDIVQEPPLSMHEEVENTDGFHLLRTEGSNGVNFFQFPHAGNRPEDTPEIDVKEVRQALNWAVDVQTVAEAIGQGMVTPVPGPWAAGHWAYPDDAWDQAYGYDPDRARELLAEAGYEDGFTLHFLTTTGFSPLDRELSEACIPYFEDIGITVEFTALERAAYSQVRDDAGSSMYYLGLGGSTDPHVNIDLYFSARGRERAFYGTDPELDDILIEGSVIVDEDERRTYYQDVVFPAVLDVAPWVFLWSLSNSLGLRDGIDVPAETFVKGWIDVMKIEVSG